MAGIGISAISPAELESVKGEDIVKFDLAYEKYFRLVQEYNRVRSASQHVPLTGIKACISAELLIDLTVLETFPECTTVADVTDAYVKDWIKERSSCSVDDMDSHVSNALQHVRFKPDMADPQGSALQFFTDVIRQLRRNRVEDAIRSASKVLIRELIPKLEPQVLRETIRSSHKYWNRDNKYNFQYFKEKVIAKALESAKYCGKRDRNDKGNDISASAGRSSSKRHKHSRGKDVGNKVSSEKPSTEKDNNGLTSQYRQGKRSRKDEWTDPCLNSKCDGIHPVKKCPITPEEMKKQLLKEYYDTLKKSNPSRKLASMRTGDINDGRWGARIDDTVPCTALGDYGSDENALPRSTVDALVQMGGTANPRKFKKPIPLRPAVKLSTTIITSSASGQFDITLSLPCGPLRLRKISFFIIDHDMDEVILGRPLLKCLGFNLDDHLERVREQYDAVDMSALMQDAINAETSETVLGSKLSSLKPYRGLWYNQSEYDPISLPDTAGANMGEDDEGDIQRAFDSAISKAATQGMSEKGLQQSRHLLKEFRDIFRIKLGPDPPANVEPMQIRLKNNHRPSKCTQRRYAPPQRAFIESTVRSLQAAGAVYSNPRSPWASPALAVAKDGPENFRFTVDLRGPNRETVPIASAMPDLESSF